MCNSNKFYAIRNSFSFTNTIYYESEWTDNFSEQENGREHLIRFTYSMNIQKHVSNSSRELNCRLYHIYYAKHIKNAVSMRSVCFNLSIND